MDSHDVNGSDCGLFLLMKHSLRYVDCYSFQKSVEHTVATLVARARWLKLVLNRCQKSSNGNIYEYFVYHLAWFYHLP